MKIPLAIFQAGLLAFVPVAARGQKGEPGTARARVVLVSVDGATDWVVDELLARGVLPADGAFARMARRGVRAEGVETINSARTLARPRARAPRRAASESSKRPRRSCAYDPRTPPRYEDARV